MTFEFAIKHWLISLLVAPLFNILIMMGMGKAPVLELIPMYLFWFVFSIGFSFPAFTFYLIVQWIAGKYLSNTLKMRTLLSAVAISGMLLTVYFFTRRLDDYDFLVSYSFAIILTAFLIKEDLPQVAVKSLK